LTIKNLNVLATKGLVYKNLKGIMGLRSRTTSSKNDPTTWLRNSSQDGNGPRGKGKMH
jgi:hypothetical protein